MSTVHRGGHNLNEEVAGDKQVPDEAQVNAHAVWKYTFAQPTTIFNMPPEAEILSVGAQGDKIVLWAKVSVSASIMEGRKFFVVNTGEIYEAEDRDRFIGTVTIKGYSEEIVWHVFERMTFQYVDKSAESLGGTGE